MFNEESFLFPARAPRATIPSRAGTRALAPRTGRHAPMPGASIGYQSRRLQRRRQTGASRMVTRRSRSESAGPPRISERRSALVRSRRSATISRPTADAAHAYCLFGTPAQAVQRTNLADGACVYFPAWAGASKPPAKMLSRTSRVTEWSESGTGKLKSHIANPATRMRSRASTSIEYG